MQGNAKMRHGNCHKLLLLLLLLMMLMLRRASGR
jgi:hypothetical protein